MDTSSAFATVAPPLSPQISRPYSQPLNTHAQTLASPLPVFLFCRPTFCISHRHPALLRSSSSDLVPDLFDGGGGTTALVVVFSLVVGLAAQSFINSMLEGDRGLGAFLSDGKGYGGSSFKPRSSGANSEATDAPLGGEDPLPWLKLPKLDYVEVAGQEKGGMTEGQQLDPKEEAEIVARLEELADLMKAELGAGNVEEAGRVRIQLERMMEEYGFTYDEGFQ